MSQVSFHYVAIDRSGANRRGTMYASDQHEAYRRIVAAGMQPIRIAMRRQWWIGFGRKRVKARDLAHFTYQFSVLMQARLSVVDGLRAIAEQETNHDLRRIIENIAASIEGGETITGALEPHRTIFGEVYLEMIHAAEVSGNLIEVLDRLSTMLEREDEMRRAIRGALIYPICVVGAMVLAMGFLMFHIVPRFASMYEGRGVELPVITRVVFNASGWLHDWWFLPLGALVALIVLVPQLWSRPAVRLRLDRVFHRVPLLRGILVGLAVSRFTHVFGLSMRSGIGLIDALNLAGKASGRPLLEDDARKMRDQVNDGGRLTDVLSTCGYLPSFTRRMLAAGEEAAEISRMCEVVARHYDREVMDMSKNIATAIEPILILALASVVLLIALTVFLPMWNMAALIG